VSLAPLSREQLGDDARAALTQAFGAGAADRLLAPDAGPMPNVLATLLHNPALAGPFLAYNNVLLRTPTIGARLREIVILRVAFRTQAPYEWAQHVRMADQAGLTAAEVDAIASGSAGAGAGEWTELETDVLRATDECIDNYRVSSTTWERLAERLDAAQLVELVFVIGTYTALAMAFNSFGIQLDPELEALAGTTLPPIGLPKIEE
jgi:alkylhydroperoxidase family enzyme